MAEGILYGHFLRTDERWKFYRAYELDLPSMKEISNLKAMIIWSSTSSPSYKENADGTPLSWIRPVVKMIKKVYKNFPKLKILGISLGQQLIALALGGKLERQSLDEA